MRIFCECSVQLATESDGPKTSENARTTAARELSAGIGLVLALKTTNNMQLKFTREEERWDDRQYLHVDFLDLWGL